MFIGAALERNHQFRRLGEIAPTPGVEFGKVVAIQVNLALVAHKAQGEPDLFLPDPALLVRRGVGWKVVSHPFLGAAEQAGGADAGLLAQLAPGGVRKVLAVVDAALRELPIVRRRGLAAASVPDAAVLVEKDDADIGPIEGEVGWGQDDWGQDDYLRAMTAEAGAS
jgi:hypothetical protein